MTEKPRLSIGKMLEAVIGRKKAAVIAGCTAMILVTAWSFATVATNQPSQFLDSTDADIPCSTDSDNSAAEAGGTTDSIGISQNDPIAGSSNSKSAIHDNATNPNSNASESSEGDTSGNGTTSETHSDSAMDPSASSRPSTSQKTWVEDAEKVWVVDKGAWTETIPVYENVEKSICNICGADITGSTSAHNKQHMLNGEGSGYHSETQRVKIGEQSIEHPEEGHWETVVVGGHWE